MMENRATHIVLLNTRANVAAASELGTKIRERFRVHGINIEIRALAEGDDIIAVARHAVAGAPDVIVAGGGDGTVSAVASAVVGTSTTLGVLPLGTLNHFARDIGLPMDVDASIDSICMGRVTRVDVGRVNDRLFLNNSSLGLYPQALRKRDTLTTQLGHAKWPAFLWAAWELFRRYPFLTVRMTVDDQSIDFRTPLVFIGNNSYELHGIEIGERRRLDAGHLSILVVDRAGRMGIVLLALRALSGRLRSGADFKTMRAQSVDVETHHRTVSVATDGEVSRLQTPLHYRVEALALSVLVPATVG